MFCSEYFHYKRTKFCQIPFPDFLHLYSDLYFLCCGVTICLFLVSLEQEICFSVSCNEVLIWISSLLSWKPSSGAVVVDQLTLKIELLEQCKDFDQIGKCVSTSDSSTQYIGSTKIIILLLISGLSRVVLISENFLK